MTSNITVLEGEAPELKDVGLSMGDDDSDLELLEVLEVDDKGNPIEFSSDPPAASKALLESTLTSIRPTTDDNMSYDFENAEILEIEDDEDESSPSNESSIDHPASSTEASSSALKQDGEFVPICVVIETRNFPYLLAPVSPEIFSKLPSELEHAITLFDEVPSSKLTFYELIDKVKARFEELENAFDVDYELVITFKDFNLSLSESSVHAHELTLEEIYETFQTYQKNVGDSAPTYLKLDLVPEKSFITSFAEIKHLHAFIKSEVEHVEHESVRSPDLVEPENDALELSEEDIKELDESLQVNGDDLEIEAKAGVESETEHSSDKQDTSPDANPEYVEADKKITVEIKEGSILHDSGSPGRVQATTVSKNEVEDKDGPVLSDRVETEVADVDLKSEIPTAETENRETQEGEAQVSENGDNLGDNKVLTSDIENGELEKETLTLFESVPSVTPVPSAETNKRPLDEDWPGELELPDAKKAKEIGESLQ